MSEPCSDLISFADDELEPERATAFRAHLKTCAACQSGLVEAMQLNARLSMLWPLPDHAPPAESLAPAHETPPRERAFETRPRSRMSKAWWGGGGVAAVLAALGVLLVIWPPRQPPQSLLAMNAFAPLQTRPYDIRFAHSDAGTYRPRAQAQRGSGGSAAAADGVSLGALAALEARGDRYSVEIALAWNDKKPADIAAKLRQLPQTRLVQADQTALELLTTSNDNAEAVLAELETLRNGDDSAARAARWNYALLLSRLGLPLSAAKAFDEIANASEPGWSDEARRRAADQAALAQAASQPWMTANAAGEALVTSGVPVSADLVDKFPGLMRAYFYNAVRTAPTRARVLALAAMAGELDRIGNQRILSDYVQRVANFDVSRRAPLATAYMQLLKDGSLTAAGRAGLLDETPSPEAMDIVMGAMVELGVVAGHADSFRRMTRRTDDPWFELLLAQAEANAALQRDDRIGAEARIRNAQKLCTRAVAYRCLALAGLLGQIYQDLHRVPEALAILRLSLATARSSGEWGHYKALLWRLADVERFNSSIATARAYANEVLLTQPEPGERRSKALMTLVGADIRGLDGAAARRALELALQDMQPDLTMANALADIGRLDRRKGDLAQLQGWLRQLRASGKLTPGQLVLADEIEGRLLIESDHAAGTRKLEQAIAAAGPAPRDIVARRARTGAYSMLAFDAAKRGEYRRVLDLVAEQLTLPPQGPCAVAMVAEDERAVIVVRGGDGQARGVSPPAGRSPYGLLPVPKELADSLENCSHVAVMAQAALQGQPRILPPELPWSYATGARSRTLAHADAHREPRVVVVANVVPPAYLQLPTLLPWAAERMPAATLSGAAATPTRVLAEIRDATEIQFHTHALVDAGISDASHLVLSPDEGGYALTAEAIRHGELRGHPVVVLAACHSAQGARYQHAAWSLPDAFLAVGARAVLAAGSTIPDLEGGPFFTSVLEQIRGGAEPARALRDERVRALKTNRSSWIADVILFE